MVILEKPIKRLHRYRWQLCLVKADRNLKSLNFEMPGLAEAGELNFTRFWNSEARFVVAVANEFSISKQTLVLYYFAHYRMYFYHILSQVIM
jgi:hypothetical protein